MTDKNKKLKKMAQELWETPVNVFPNTGEFPTTGEIDELYCDESTASEDDLSDADLYYWNGAAYTNFVVGPRPRRPHL